MMAEATADSISPGTMLKAKSGMSVRDMDVGVYFKIKPGDSVMVLAHSSYHVPQLNCEVYKLTFMLPSGDVVSYAFRVPGFLELFDVL